MKEACSGVAARREEEGGGVGCGPRGRDEDPAFVVVEAGVLDKGEAEHARVPAIASS